MQRRGRAHGVRWSRSVPGAGRHSCLAAPPSPAAFRRCTPSDRVSPSSFPPRPASSREQSPSVHGGIVALSTRRAMRPPLRHAAFERRRWLSGTTRGETAAICTARAKGGERERGRRRRTRSSGTAPVGDAWLFRPLRCMADDRNAFQPRQDILHITRVDSLLGGDLLTSVWLSADGRLAREARHSVRRVVLPSVSCAECPPPCCCAVRLAPPPVDRVLFSAARHLSQSVPRRTCGRASWIHTPCFLPLVSRPFAELGGTQPSAQKGDAAPRSLCARRPPSQMRHRAAEARTTRWIGRRRDVLPLPSQATLQQHQGSSADHAQSASKLGCEHGGRRDHS